MPHRIADIVEPIEGAELVNDVRLDAYPSDPSNLSLTQRYIFTAKATAGHISSIALLNEIKTAFLYPRENRYVVLATYGHGKSHLALALANFFGKPADSPEAELLLQRIEHVADPSTAQGIREFKQGRAPYLVVRLRGDQPAGLDQQFLRGVELALHEAGIDSGARIPFWFTDAESFLKSLSAEQELSANKCLSERGLDVAQLRQRVAEKDGSVFQLCRQVFKHLFGTMPDFGAEVSLQKVVEWVADTHCGEGKPLSGMLVLFDEFSAFIRRYAERRGTGGGTPLQDLLNGIANRQRLTAFLAFSQYDPNSVAKSAAREALLDDREDDITKELERLPYPQRHPLYSSLETVLDAFLRQDVAAWESLMDEPDVLDTCQTATDLTMQLTSPIYDDIGWGPERVFEVLTHGCFPLHPLTTALLCNVGFKERTNPRSVFGFVAESLNRLKDQPAVVDGRPNWVYPFALVDWFGDMLADREYLQYLSARDQAGAEIPPIQLAVLKGMLLHAVGQLKSKRMRYSRAISQLTGYSEKECREALETLHGGGYIRFDEVQNAYTFYAVGAVAARLEELVRERLRDKSLDGAAIQKLNTAWQEGDRLSPIAVDNCPWAHPEDLAARQFVLPARFFNSDNVRRFARRIGWSERMGIVEEPRGCVIWLVPETDAKLDQVRANAERILDEALDATPIPVIVAIPAEAHPNFEKHVLREEELRALPSEIKREQPAEVLHDTQKRLTAAVDSELERLKEGTEFVVPQPYRTRFRAEAQASGITVRRALTVSYKEAYKYSPPRFQTQYRAATGHRLRSAVNLVSRHLADDSLMQAIQAIDVNPVAKDLVRTILSRGAQGSWGLISTEGAITIPTSARVQEAWKVLDEAFPAGEAHRPLRDTLLTLMNPPYGYDFNQLALLFCAWHGHYRADAEITSGSGAPIAIADFYPLLEKPRDFIFRLCRCNLARRDRAEVVQEIEQIADTVSKAAAEQYSLSEADALSAKLTLFAEDALQDASLRKRAEKAAQRLDRAIEISRDYEQKAKALDSTARTATAVTALSKCLRDIESLPSLGIVRVDVDAPSTLKQTVISRISSVVDAQCRKLERLSGIEQYELNRQHLQLMLNETRSIGRSEITARVTSAQQTLEAARAALKALDADVTIIASIKAIPDSGTLAQMRVYQAQLNAYSPGSEQARKLLEDKSHALANAIEAAEHYAQALDAKVSQVASIDQARQLSTQIQRQIDRFEGTDEHKVIERAAARCEALEGCFREVDALGSLDPRAPADAASLQQKLDAIEKRSASALSELQRGRFKQARLAVSEAARSKEELAVKWLEDLAEEAGGTGTLGQLLRKLETVPPFLPESRMTDVTALRQQIQERIDSDEVLRVTEHFRRITDRQRRVECLTALQQIAAELDG